MKEPVAYDAALIRAALWKVVEARKEAGDKNPIKSWAKEAGLVENTVRGFLNSEDPNKSLNVGTLVELARVADLPLSPLFAQMLGEEYSSNVVVLRDEPRSHRSFDKELDEVDLASIRAIREFLVTLPECPERLQRLEHVAQQLRQSRQRALENEAPTADNA